MADAKVLGVSSHSWYPRSGRISPQPVTDPLADYAHELDVSIAAIFTGAFKPTTFLLPQSPLRHSFHEWRAARSFKAGRHNRSQFRVDLHWQLHYTARHAMDQSTQTVHSAGGRH